MFYILMQHTTLRCKMIDNNKINGNAHTTQCMVVHVQIPRAVVNQIDSIAQAESRTRSNVIRLALDAFIESYGIAE